MRAPRRAHPHAAALEEQSSDFHIVVFQKNEPAAEPIAAARLHDALHEQLALIVARMCFAGKDDYKWTIATIHQAFEAVGGAQYPAPALVRGEAPGQPPPHSAPHR